MGGAGSTPTPFWMRGAGCGRGFLRGSKNPFPLYRVVCSPKHTIAYYPHHPPHNPGSKNEFHTSIQRLREVRASPEPHSQEASKLALESGLPTLIPLSSLTVV